MRNVKTNPPLGGTGKQTIAATLSAFLERGQQAQQAVDRILSAEAKRNPSPRPKADDK